MEHELKISEKHRIDFTFREKLNGETEGFRHNLCYQCGACVADCPAANYSQSFNPRLIMLEAILGFQDKLIQQDSVIWNCTNCYTCSERCPQDVRPIDVIIALKNMCEREGKAPEMVGKISNAVLESGITTKMTSLALRRREEFELPVQSGYPIDELKKMIDHD